MPDNLGVNKITFANWAANEIAAKNLVVVSDNHGNTAPRYEVFNDIIKKCQPGILFMEVPTTVANNVNSVTNYWSNTAFQGAMNPTVQLAHDKGWSIRNVDALMAPGKSVIPETGKQIMYMGKERQAYMATNIRKFMQAEQNKGALFIVGTDHVTGKKAKGLKNVPTFTSLLTFNFDPQISVVKLAGNEELVGCSVSRKDMSIPGAQAATF